MGMLVLPAVDVFGDCETCGESLSRYGGHAACTVERLTAEVERLRQALAGLAGDYGCTTIEPLDPAFPPTGDPCRDRRPDQPETWCYACHASDALSREGAHG